MPLFNRTSAAPKEQPAAEKPEETATSMRERVTSMTSAELARTIAEMNNAKEMPEIFRERGVQDAIEKRMAEVDVSLNTKEQWQRLSGAIAANPVADMAEEKFVEEMEQKGGIKYRIGKFLLKMFGWLGFKKAIALQESIKEKGYFRTALEGAKQYPAFTSFLAMIGVKATPQVTEYLKQNEAPITKVLEEKISASGDSAEEVVKSYAERVKDVAAKAADGGIAVLAKGLAGILGGTYDEETGVVSIPSLLGESATIRPPVIMAWQAGARLRGGNTVLKAAYSTMLVENRFKTFLREAKGANKQLDAAMEGKRTLAERGLEIIKKNNGFAISGKEGKELEDILTVLEKDVGFTSKDVMQTIGADPKELEARRAEVLSHMDDISKQEIADFNATKTRVETLLKNAEENMKKGNHGGTQDEYRKTVVEEVNKITAEYNAKATAMKVAEGHKAASLMNMLDAQVQEHLQRAKQPNVVNRALEKTASSMESFGFSMAKSPVGFVVKGVAAYSFLPLITEGVAAFRQGEEGAAAQKAVMLDATEAGLGFVPIVGNVMDFRAAIMGTDLNGRELDTWGRVTSAAFGTVGMAADILGFFTAGTTTVAYRAARGAMKAGKAVFKTADTVKTVGATADVIKSANAAADTIKGMENMYDTTASVSKAGGLLHKAHNVARGAQHSMQIVTYTQLGVSLAMGMSTVAENIGGALENAGNFAQKGVGMVNAGVDATVEAAQDAKDYVIQNIPSFPHGTR